MAFMDENGHYESKFEYPLWTLIKKIADKKDISYAAASEEAVLEYGKDIRYRDEAYYKAEVDKRNNEILAARGRPH